MKSNEPSADRHDQPISGRGHLEIAVTVPAGDAFARLDELMSVVEALCPVWPARPAFDKSAEFRL